jgi:hypothetical protein
MSLTIDLSQLKRPPTKDDIDAAQRLLEKEIPLIIERNKSFFEENNFDKRIEYFISHALTDGAGLVTYKVPFLSFTDSWLSKDIKTEVTKSFFNSLFLVINKE